MRILPTLSTALVSAIVLSAAVLMSAATSDSARDRAGGSAERAADPSTTGDAREKPQRVIVRISRHREVAGTVELEDEDVIAVRTERGEIESFVKSRVLQIVRLVDPQPGQKGIVLLRDGQVREGIILEDTYEQVLVEIEGVRARLLREIVDRVILEPTFEEQYAEMLASVELHQRDRYLLFCRWLFEQREYDLAEKHLTMLLEHVDRDVREHPEAQRLLRLVQAQIALHHEVENRGADQDGSSRSSREPALDRSYLISHDDVNIIRVYEIDFDRPPRITIDPETIRRLIRDYGASKLIPASKTERDAMFRANPVDIVRLMFELRAREYYDKINVHSEPYAMNVFRERVHNRWLLNNCATCHAGSDAGRFALYRRGYRSDRVRYTNFLILERLDLGGEWPLINYDNPEMSLIIQYGLPMTHARLPHPEVRGWRPAFRSADDRMVNDTIYWINSMMQPRPEYPVEFDPHPIMPGEAPSALAEADDQLRVDDDAGPGRQSR